MIPLLLAALLAAPERDWTYLGSAETGSHWYADMATIKIVSSNSRRRVWIHMDHSGDRTELARKTVGLLEIDCDVQTFVWVQISAYAPDGSSLSQSGYSDTRYISPHTMIEAAQEKICPPS